MFVCNFMTLIHVNIRSTEAQELFGDPSSMVVLFDVAVEPCREKQATASANGTIDDVEHLQECGASVNDHIVVS